MIGGSAGIDVLSLLRTRLPQFAFLPQMPAGCSENARQFRAMPGHQRKRSVNPIEQNRDAFAVVTIETAVIQIAPEFSKPSL